MIAFRFVQDHRGDHDVTRLCRLVGASRSTFYTWAAGPTPAAVTRQESDAELVVVIHQIWIDSRRTYGAPRVHGQLVRRGFTVSKRRVAKLMQHKGFVGAHTRKKWRRGRPDVAPAPDLLRRAFHAERPTSGGSPTSPISPLGRASCSWPASATCATVGSSGGPWTNTKTPCWVVEALTMALARTPT